LIVLPGNFERYEQFSNWMFGYCYDFTPDVEQTSIDEGYFDLTANRKKLHESVRLQRPRLRCWSCSWEIRRQSFASLLTGLMIGS